MHLVWCITDGFFDGGITLNENFQIKDVLDLLSLLYATFVHPPKLVLYTTYPLG